MCFYYHLDLARSISKSLSTVGFFHHREGGPTYLRRIYLQGGHDGQRLGFVDYDLVVQPSANWADVSE